MTSGGVLRSTRLSVPRGNFTGSLTELGKLSTGTTASEVTDVRDDIVKGGWTLKILEIFQYQWDLCNPLLTLLHSDNWMACSIVILKVNLLF